MRDLPVGWRAEPLGAVADIRASNVDKHSRFGELPVRLCNYLDVYQEDYLGAEHLFVAGTATNAEVAKFGLRPGDVIVTKDSETPYDIGVAAVIESGPKNLVCGYHLAILRPISRLNPVWLAKQFASPQIKGYLAAQATGTTRYGLSNATLSNLRVPVPAREEQDGVVKVLQTADEAIRLTEELIAKLERLKQGLLHDLLTRGIDENGQLRDRKRHPEQFKASPLGWIPIDWEVKTLVDTAKPGKEGFDDGDWIETPYITSDGIRLVQTGNIGVGDFLDKPDRRRFISERSFRTLRCKWVNPGDILICRLADPIGRACVVPEVIGACVTAVDCTIYRPDPMTTDRRFALHWLNSNRSLAVAADVAGGSTRQRISRRNLGLLPFPQPGIDEQRRISAYLDALGAHVQQEATEVAKLKALRQGLAEDLLSGRIRVTKLLRGHAA